MINIIDKTKCCGCSACASVCPKNCIAMSSDNEGFLYPIVDQSKCVNCDLCQKVCPVLTVEKEIPKEQKTWLVQNRDEKILQESTSGGAFSAFAVAILCSGGIVFGAAFDENMVVRHISVESVDELYKFRNSKYVQSAIGDSFTKVKEYLKNGRKVLFSGTPCQVEGLKKYLRKDYQNLYTVDVVCHACPSPLIWEKYKQYRFKDKTTIKSAKFRDKSDYGYDYSQISLSDNKKRLHFGVESDPYLRAFFSNLSDRPSCYHCAFKKRYRVSDVTIWDCFDVYKLDKSFDDNRGVTRVLGHTEKADYLISQAINTCKVKQIDVEKALAGVKEMVLSVQENPLRTQFFIDAENLSADELFKKWFPDTLKVKIERLVRHIFEKLGIYAPMKRLAKKILKK